MKSLSKSTKTARKLVEQLHAAVGDMQNYNRVHGTYNDEIEGMAMDVGAVGVSIDVVDRLADVLAELDQVWQTRSKVPAAQVREEW